jgi:hypothetical protein
MNISYLSLNHTFYLKTRSFGFGGNTKTIMMPKKEPFLSAMFFFLPFYK